MKSLEQRILELEVKAKGYTDRPIMKSLRDLMILTIIMVLFYFSMIHLALTVGIGLEIDPLENGEDFFLVLTWIVNCGNIIGKAFIILIPLFNAWSYLRFKELTRGKNGK